MKDLSFIRKLIIEQKVIFVILFIMFLNFLFLDYLVVKNSNILPKSAGATYSGSSDNCGTKCIEQINIAVNNLKATLPQVTPSAPVYTQTSATSSNTNAGSTGPSDFYVPLGIGVSSATSYAFVPGTQAYINSAQYAGSSAITFETSVAVYNANEDVYVQLYDVTAGHMVWNSTVLSHSGATGNLMISSPITLDPGNNLYQVQVQTQLGAPANITQAQVHIHYN